MEVSRRGGMAACVAIVLLIGAVRGYYLPGIAPTDYGEGRQIEVYADKLTSNSNKIPFDYHSLPLCEDTQQSLRAQHLNFGEILLGDRDELTEYEVFMNVAEKCKVYCIKNMTPKEMQKIAKRIDDDYYVELNVDNMPSIFRYLVDGQEYQAHGFPIGYREKDRYFLFNHLTFKILIHKPTLSVMDISNVNAPADQLFRVVGFEITPESADFGMVDDVNATSLDSCDTEGTKPFELVPTSETKQTVIMTYDVTFEMSSTKWATRWDPLLQADPEFKNIQWFYLFNAVAIMLFLFLLVAGILLRTIYLDFARFNQLDDVNDVDDDSGWKQVHGDVFRPPEHRGALAVACGTGTQLIVMAVVTLAFAHFGFFSPAYRGGLLSALIFFWVTTSVVSGFVTAQMYLMMGGSQKKLITTAAALFFSGLLFASFFIANLVLSLAGSSAAVNFFTLLTLLALWLFISGPLTVLGAFIGFKAKPIDLPTRVNAAPRPVPNYTTIPPAVFALVSGIIPFGVVFIQLTCIFNSLWQNDMFYMFGFLFVAFTILLVTSAEVSIVLTYLILCKEDWRWWWISFSASASSGFYVFLYSVYFLFSHSGLEGIHVSSIFLFTTYSFLISVSFALLTGAMGFLSTLVLVRKLYAGVHMD